MSKTDDCAKFRLKGGCAYILERAGGSGGIELLDAPDNTTANVGKIEVAAKQGESLILKIPKGKGVIVSFQPKKEK